MANISLGQQIEEIEREIVERERVYPGLVARGRMRQSIADYHIDRMRAALRTLRWVHRHQEAIRAAVREPGAGDGRP